MLASHLVGVNVSRQGRVITLVNLLAEGVEVHLVPIEGGLQCGQLWVGWGGVRVQVQQRPAT